MIFRITVVQANGKTKTLSSQPGGGGQHTPESILAFYQKHNVFPGAQSILVEELDAPALRLAEVADGAVPQTSGRKVISTAKWPDEPTADEAVAGAPPEPATEGT